MSLNFKASKHLTVFYLFNARPSVSRHCGTLGLRTQVFIVLCLIVMSMKSCGGLAIFAAFLVHIYRVHIKLRCSLIFIFSCSIKPSHTRQRTVQWLICFFIWSGTKATDDSEIPESHAESGKRPSEQTSAWQSILVATEYTEVDSWWIEGANLLILCRLPISTKRLRTVQAIQGCVTVTAPHCFLSVLCRKWGKTYSSTSACPLSSCYLLFSARPPSSTGFATWGADLICLELASLDLILIMCFINWHYSIFNTHTVERSWHQSRTFETWHLIKGSAERCQPNVYWSAFSFPSLLRLRAGSGGK